MKRSRSPQERQSIARRMTPGAAGGRTPLIAPVPPTLMPLQTAHIAAGGTTGAAVIYSNGALQTVASGSAVVLTASCFNADSIAAMSDVSAVNSGSVQIDTATGQIVVVTAGTFLVGAQIEWTGSGGTYRYMDIQRDGSPPSASPLIARSKVAAVSGACQSCMGVVTGGPGDTFFVSAGHDNGTTADVGGTAASFLWAVGIGSYGSAI